ncbi:MAG: hypothetical protein C9356_12015 [Oleiphilus sp.]|nr:MAG: hypothetical protein C9356_12015 [Oleiphilus sp.]
MKIVEIPAVLRIFVDDDVTQEAINRLAEGMVSEACGTVCETDLHEDLKEHLKGADLSGGERILEADLWVFEKPVNPVVHPC